MLYLFCIASCIVCISSTVIVLQYCSFCICFALLFVLYVLCVCNVTVLADHLRCQGPPPCQGCIFCIFCIFFIFCIISNICIKVRSPALPGASSMPRVRKPDGPTLKSRSQWNSETNDEETNEYSFFTELQLRHQNTCS